MKYLFVICFLFQFYTSSATAQAYKYHTVKAGETVFSISQAYDIDEEDIYKFNPDAKDGIGVNEKLVIPIVKGSTTQADNSVSFQQHKVEKKETLYSLSKAYGVSVDDIKKYNKHLYSEELRNGETIRIPIKVSSNAAVRTTENRREATPRVQDKRTREHIVLPKETKFGIARKYGMTLEELNELNPRVEVLQPGMMIRVGTNVLKDEPVIILDERFTFYEVKPRETLYSLSQRFGVSQDSLKRLNPALQEGLKFGMVLKVPERGTGEQEADSEIARFEPAPGNKLDLSRNITNRQTKNLVLMLPYKLQQIDRDSLDTYRKAIMNERVLRISLDFQSGVMMALDKASSMGIATNLKIYDTRQNASETANIVNTNNFNNVDAVIGPLLQETTEAVASRLERFNVPVINPLSNREMNGYGNLFQSRPTDEILRQAMLEYISRNSAGKNIIIIADAKSVQIKNELSNALPNARFINPSDNYVNEGKIREMLSPNKNWVILESENINLLSSATSALNRLARSHDITLLTTHKNNSYENDIISNNHLGKLKFHYPSVDKEYDADISEEFITSYEERFGIEPNQYAVRGYDLALDVILRLASADNLYESFERYPGYTEYFESKFHYLPNSRGGFYNDAVYILKMDENLLISEANDL